MSGNDNRNEGGRGREYRYGNDNDVNTSTSISANTANVNNTKREDSRNVPEPRVGYQGGGWKSESSTADEGDNMSSSWSIFRATPSTIAPSQLPPMPSSLASSTASLPSVASEFRASRAELIHPVKRENHNGPGPGLSIPPNTFTPRPFTSYDFTHGFPYSDSFLASLKPTAAGAIESAVKGEPASGPPNKCICNFCEAGAYSLCLKLLLAKNKAMVRGYLEDEYQRSRERVEELLEMECQSTLEHHQYFWAHEKQQLDGQLSRLMGNVATLESRNRDLENENRKLTEEIKSLHDRRNAPPIIHHGSRPVNSPLFNSGPPPAILEQQRLDGIHKQQRLNRIRESVRADLSAIFDVWPKSPSPAPYVPASPQTATRQNLGPFPLVSPSPISYGLGRDTTGAASPEYSPASPTIMMRNAVSEPKRSPKRSASVIDVDEVDSKLEDMAPGAGAAQGSPSAETYQQRESQSPPIKRRRSMSHEYYITTDLKTEQGVEEEELQRLTMHAGHTPNISPSFPSATATAEPSGSRTAPATSPSLSVEGSSNINSDDYEHVKTEGEAEVKNEAREEEETSAKEESSRTTATAEEGGIISYSDGSSHHSSYPSIPSSPSSQQALLEAMDDHPLSGPLMIKNIPAQDELFLAALKEKLEPISQGQDALPRAVQAPVAARVPLSTVSGRVLGDAVGNQNTVPNNTDISEAQSDSEEEPDSVFIKKEPRSPVRWAATEDNDDDQDAPVKVEQPVKSVDKDTSDSESDSGPELPLKIRRTCNFGAPFGKM